VRLRTTARIIRQGGCVPNERSERPVERFSAQTEVASRVCRHVRPSSRTSPLRWPAESCAPPAVLAVPPATSDRSRGCLQTRRIWLAKAEGGDSNPRDGSRRLTVFKTAEKPLQIGSRAPVGAPVGPVDALGVRGAPEVPTGRFSRCV
jgi:hypothetical protein